MQRVRKITLGEMRETGPTRPIVCCADYKCARPGLLPSCMSPEFQRVDADLNQPGRWQCSDLIQHRLGRMILPLFHLSR